MNADGSRPKPAKAPGGAKPYIKWPGGKRQMLPALRPFYPAEFTAYHEPFLGAGAVLIDLLNAGRLEGRTATGSDINGDLVGTWTHVRDRTDETVDELRALVDIQRSTSDPTGHFYLIRQKFNTARMRIARPGWPVKAESYTAQLAAWFIYLNKTAFNGLFRLSRAGHFNAPCGGYKKPRILDEENLREVAANLQKGAVRLKQRSFENSLAAAQPRDFVYLDPPYSPTNSVARFTGYTADGFGPHDQEKLQHEVLRLARQGTGILLSNSVTPETDRLYRDDVHIAAARLTVRTAPARRSINSDGGKRTGSEDYIVTNMTAAEGRSE